MAEHGFAALPVVDDDRLVGIVAEADVLRDRAPPDPRLHLRRDDGTDRTALSLLARGVMTADVRGVEPAAAVADVARVFGDERLLDAWEVTVTHGLATIRRTRGLPEPSAEVEQRTLSALARTVGGVVAVRVPPTVDVPAQDATRAAPTNA